jgi:hypothetical protein
MELIPPTLEDVGFMLWGADWREPMAISLNLSDDELKACEDDPDNIPTGTEMRLLELCVIRSQEIGMIHDLLQAAGLRRTLEG